MPYGCGCALVIVTALVVTVVLVVMHLVRGVQQPGAAESTIAITGSAAVLSDGVTIVYSDPNGLCRTEGLTATETSSRVVLSLSGSERLDDLGCAGFGTGGPVGSPGGPPIGNNPATTVTVGLSSPLGDRRLVDAVTGKTIPCFDQRGALLLPKMAGWIQWPAPENLTTNVPYLGGPGAAVLAEELFGADSRTLVLNGMSLMIVQVAGGGWHPPAGTVTAHVLVRGRPGLAAPGILVWSEGGHTIAVIGEGQDKAGESAGAQSRPPLPLASLEAIASALTGDG